jgi:ElaB/YqjD/DUF883 family membrane-anchored ribosome-binding protein
MPNQIHEPVDAKERSSVGFSPEGEMSMSDQAAEGSVADAGRAVQSELNQAGDAKEQLTKFIRDRPICAALVAVGIGYLLGKII